MVEMRPSGGQTVYDMWHERVLRVQIMPPFLAQATSMMDPIIVPIPHIDLTD